MDITHMDISRYDIAPRSASALADKITAVRDMLGACLLPDVEVYEETRGGDHGFVISGADVATVERIVRDMGVAVTSIAGVTIAFFRAA
jgi:hypothetical protein